MDSPEVKEGDLLKVGKMDQVRGGDPLNLEKGIPTEVRFRQKKTGLNNNYYFQNIPKTNFKNLHVKLLFCKKRLSEYRIFNR